ncbi:hypothetical protein CDL15_Pgr023712 [Punica granatum]|uniref:Uncharacterized protein n=1 Tax=Punica granatum TaxID=22663 RepID=A0A218XM80_PUNGR|nr:hypothetical protein CDL15_Pgr023712 [Punica granatum]
MASAILNRPFALPWTTAYIFPICAPPKCSWFSTPCILKRYASQEEYDFQDTRWGIEGYGWSCHWFGP